MRVLGVSVINGGQIPINSPPGLRTPAAVEALFGDEFAVCVEGGKAVVGEAVGAQRAGPLRRGGQHGARLGDQNHATKSAFVVDMKLAILYNLAILKGQHRANSHFR
jgi:hypothetical protein